MDGVILSSGEHTSLMHGWVPVTVQAAAVATLVLALGRRPRSWLWRLPVSGDPVDVDRADRRRRLERSDSRAATRPE
ncbi:hypothetical protein MHIB_12680 [Mycolicibacter hiberniae]|uniref:Uncharacterized protein n=1 Tax=Mycolicibacter hiberniae TaxID=29314 RepID=A0A7I7X0P8_9MYCO|nr:hypothetical protein AWC09_00140 [Mycolicibacter hiberniae]BBZ22850.1 hypothetical protein MHIB_12680 [Mycolicibacter hiberniae]